MKQRLVNIIEAYNKTLIGLIVKILDKNKINYDGKESKSNFLEKFWKLYTDKKIEKKGTFQLENTLIEYNFHGGGCFFKSESIEVDSNFYNTDSQFSINFGVDILWYFMDKNGLLENSDTRNAIFENLETLCNESKIYKSSYFPFHLYYSDL